MSLTDQELVDAGEWAEANQHTHKVAEAYWALMSSKAALNEVEEALDREWETVLQANAHKTDHLTEMPDEWCAATDALEALEDAWFTARDRLGRLCLVAMRAAG